ncbi:MAG: hypothetical protein KKA60_15770 [Proteobacteria bacterium]|nr:hypothetical protein [Pseudomonadota bacterium]
MDTQLIAWNGLRFLAPAGWRPTKIGPRFLHFADSRGPVMDIRWKRVGRRFSPGAWVKQARGLAPAPLDPDWERALGDFATTGLSARGPAKARGLAAFCPETQNAFVFLFYGEKPPARRITRVLASFSDHSVDPDVLWSLFDIQARTPRELALKKHRFEAGRFELSFSGRGTSLTLTRWAPATALLEGRTLAEWVRERLPQASGLSRDTDDQALVQWEEPPSPSAAKRLARRLSGRPAHTLCRAWVVPEKNRILAAAASSGRPMDKARMLAVFDSFQAV